MQVTVGGAKLRRVRGLFGRVHQIKVQIPAL